MTAAVERAPPMSTRASGLAFALSAGLLLSTNGLLLRLIGEADQWQIIVYRSGSLGLAILLFLAIRYRLALFGAFRSLGWTGLLGGLILGISFPTYVLSLSNTTVANALFLMSTSPVIAAVLGLIFLGEAVRGTTWLAIIGTMAGVGVMVYDGLDGGGMFGNAVALLNAFLYAIYTLLVRRNRHVDMMPALAIGGFVGGGIGALGASTFVLTPHDLGLCLFMGAVQLTLGFTLITLAAQRAPIAEVNLVAMIEMVTGPVIVWFGVAELPSDLTILGGSIVLISVGGLAVSGIVEARRPAERKAARNGSAEREDFLAALRQAETRALVHEGLLMDEAPLPVPPVAMTSAPIAPVAMIPVAAPPPFATPASPTAEAGAPSPIFHRSVPMAEHERTVDVIPPEPRLQPPVREPVIPEPVMPERAIRGPIIRGSVERQLQIALEPMLRAWVEANLRRLVAPILRREIRTLVRKSERMRRQ